MDTRTVVVIGAGVVGSAVAAELARKFSEVYLVEAQPRPGMMTSTRNSGVLHSGIYYPAGSLKARLCVRGNRLLRQFCDEAGVAWKATGKLIIATSDAEIPQLRELKERGERNGVENIRLISTDEVQRREPHVRVAAALHVPSTAIVQTEELVQALVRLARGRGVELATHTQLLGAQRRADGRIQLRTSTGDFDADLVINCAGLYADRVAAMFGDDQYRIYPCRGEYVRINPSRKPNLVRGLVYPLPTPVSLGIHLTRTVHGDMLIGPTATYLDDRDDYESNLLPVEYFWEQARSFVPGLEVDDLALAYTGIRPKLTPGLTHEVPKGEKAAGVPGDFVIEWSRQTPGVLHLVGIDSPGLTSSLALAEEVSARVCGEEAGGRR